MAFTTFNPRTFEKIWRKWQPKGNLVFADLPPEAQNALLDEMAKCVDFELGFHFINGIFGGAPDGYRSLYQMRDTKSIAAWVRQLRDGCME